MSLVPCEISVNTPILFHFHTFCQMRGMANTPQRLCHNTFKVAFSRPAQHTDKARCFSSPSSYIHQCTQKQRTDWFGVREYQTPLCCGCHSLCLSESLFVLTLTRTKSLSTTTLACIVLIQIITRQLIYIYFFLILFSKAKQPSSQQVVQLTQQKGTVSHLLCSCSPVKQINWPWKWPVWCKQLLSLCSQKQKVSHFVFTSEFGFRFNAVYLQCIYLHLNYLSYVSLKRKHYGSVQTCKKIFLSFI